MDPAGAPAHDAEQGLGSVPALLIFVLVMVGVAVLFVVVVATSGGADAATHGSLRLGGGGRVS